MQRQHDRRVKSAGAAVVAIAGSRSNLRRYRDAVNRPVDSASALASLNGSAWRGSAELWLDPAGNEAECCYCTLKIEAAVLRYRWFRDGSEQNGQLRLTGDGASWQDSWHRREAVACTFTPGNRALFTVEYDYPAPPGPDWSWRLRLAQRPDGQLVLQMTNITPWGEEGRAFRMILAPVPDDTET